MLQQLNKGQVPQQQPVPGRGMAFPSGGLPYGMADQRLPGADTFGNATPKPQPSPQQVCPLMYIFQMSTCRVLAD